MIGSNGKLRLAEPMKIQARQKLVQNTKLPRTVRGSSKVWQIEGAWQMAISSIKQVPAQLRRLLLWT